VDEKSTSQFASDSQFVISPPSFLKQLPSQEGFEALEDTVLVSLSYQDLQALFEAHPTARSLTRMITERYLIFMDERVRVLKCMTGKQKYAWFAAYHPELRNRVPDKHVASYLGLSTMQLNRVRKADR
jgi:CRP-like cAMP-binding protein